MATGPAQAVRTRTNECYDALLGELWPAYGKDATGMVFSEVPKAWPGLARARFELHEAIVCRRRAHGSLQWNWNVGIISPPLPPEVPACN